MFNFKCLLSLPLFCFLLAAVAAGQGPQGPPGGPEGKPDGPPGFGPPPFGMPSFPLKDALDTDGDGKLSAAEIKAAVASLKKLDKNKDGKLDADELGWPPQFPGMPSGGGPGGPGGPGGGPGGPGGRGFPFGGNQRGFASRLMARDANGDGKVTKDELPKSMQFLISRGDQDQDGAIDAKEAHRLAQQLGLASSPSPQPPSASFPKNP